MKRIGLAVFVLAACGGTQSADTGGDTDSCASDFFTADEWAVISELSPLPALEPDVTNAVGDDPAAAALGQMFFFETAYSLVTDTDPTNDGTESCAKCHDPDAWFQVQTDEEEDWRNSPTLVNTAFYEWFVWDGGRDSIWSQSLFPPEKPLKSSRLTVAHVIYDKYRDEYNAVFDPDLPPELDLSHPDAGRFPFIASPSPFVPQPNDWEGMTEADRHTANQIYANFGKAIGAYLRLLVSEDAPFDRYVAGDCDAISSRAKRGLRLFIGKAGCIGCHSGPLFTDDDFHATGVSASLDTPLGRSEGIVKVLADEFNSVGPHSDGDPGLLAGLSPAPGDETRFRTKHLRQIAETGRYMHSGQLPGIADVIEFYDQAAGNELTELYGLSPLLQPLFLTADEKDDLAAFLATLTGEPILANLREDTAKP